MKRHVLCLSLAALLLGAGCDRPERELEGDAGLTESDAVNTQLTSGSADDAALDQVLKVVPEKPKRGDTLTIAYDPSEPGSVFKPEQSLSVYVDQLRTDGQTSIIKRVPLTKVGNLLTCKVVVDNEVSAITLSLTHRYREESDPDSQRLLMVYRADVQPVRGAYLAMVEENEEAYQEWIDRELALYPDNYFAYDHKWNAVTWNDKSQAKAVIEADINQVGSQVEGEPLSWLYSLAQGYLSIGQEEKARQVLRRMMEKYSDAPQTGSALLRYRNQNFLEHFTGPGPQEVNQMALDYMKRNPTSEPARTLAGALGADATVPFEEPERVLRKWIADEPLNTLPYLMLSGALSAREQSLELVVSLSDTALDLLLQGYKEDVYSNEFVEQNFLPGIYYWNARAAFELGHYSKALSAIKTAQALSIGTPADYLLLEASIWEKAGMITKAEEVYLAAWQIGSQEANVRLQSIYVQDGGVPDEFEEWLSTRSAGRESVASGDTVKERFADFNLRAHDGAQYVLSALRGQVVVLNFWFIGCGPCYAEMPALNELVKEYESHGVVFLAATFDDSESIEEFLKEKAFDYEIIPNAQEWIDELGVTSYPTHYVINGEGEVELMLLGGGEENVEQVRNVLARLVAAE